MKNKALCTIGMMMRVRDKHCLASQIEEFISDCETIGFEVQGKALEGLLRATDNGDRSI